MSHKALGSSPSQAEQRSASGRPMQSERQWRAEGRGYGGKGHEGLGRRQEEPGLSAHQKAVVKKNWEGGNSAAAEKHPGRA